MQTSWSLNTAASGLSSSPVSSNAGSMSSGRLSPFADPKRQQQAWNAGVVYPADPAPPPPLFIRAKAVPVQGPINTDPVASSIPETPVLGLRIITKPAQVAAVQGPVIVKAGSSCSSDGSSSKITRPAGLLSRFSVRKLTISSDSSPTCSKAATQVPTSPEGHTHTRLFLGCLPLPFSGNKASATVKVPCDTPAATTSPSSTTSSKKHSGLRRLLAAFRSKRTGAASPVSLAASTDEECHPLENFSSALSSMSSLNSFYSLPVSPALSRSASLDEAGAQQASHSVTEVEPAPLAPSAAGNSTSTAAATAAAAAAAAAAADPIALTMGWRGPNVPQVCTCVDMSPQIEFLRVSRPAIGCLLCGAPMAGM